MKTRIPIAIRIFGALLLLVGLSALFLNSDTWFGSRSPKATNTQNPSQKTGVAFAPPPGPDVAATRSPSQDVTAIQSAPQQNMTQQGPNAVSNSQKISPGQRKKRIIRTRNTTLHCGTGGPMTAEQAGPPPIYRTHTPTRVVRKLASGRNVRTMNARRVRMIRVITRTTRITCPPLTVVASAEAQQSIGQSSMGSGGASLPSLIGGGWYGSG